jgi:hypothetical protein
MCKYYSCTYLPGKSNGICPVHIIRTAVGIGGDGGVGGGVVLFSKSIISNI